MLRVGAADDLADHPAEGVGHVAAAGPRLEQRVHVRDAVHHPVPVAHQLGCDAQGHQGHADAVSQRVEHRALVLAVLAELGPVFGHGLVVVHQPALRLDVEGGGGHRLDIGEHREESVAVDLRAGGLVGLAAPLVDHQFAVQVCCYLHPDFAALSDGDVDGLLNDAARVIRHGGASALVSCAGGLVANGI